ncbi:MAG: C40 family peptidase [Gemmatimonadota bacterium]
MAKRALLTLSLACAIPAGMLAQRPNSVEKKPFAEFSASAQRVRDSLVARLAPPIALEVTSSIDFALESILHDSLVAVARSQMGVRYRLGAATPGKALDCSSLVRFVMAALRIDLPRTAHEQSQLGQAVDKDVSGLRPGDLLTFGRSTRRVTHIGVYIGEGKFIHASTTARKVVESSIAKSGTWYTRHWLGVRRVLSGRDAVAS